MFTPSVVREGTMVLTVFRSRMNPDMPRERVDEYMQLLARMSELAKQIPGYVSHKGFVAPDGERAVIVEFETGEALRAWATHPEHVQAKKQGRGSFYAEYRVQVCSVQRNSAFSRAE